MGRYKPEYAEGQILVCFAVPVDARSVEYFGEKLGYSPVLEQGGTRAIRIEGIENIGHDTYIYSVPPGKEDKACEDFKGLGGLIVNWTERRDLKWERRHVAYHRAMYIMENLDGLESNVSDGEYKEGVEKALAKVRALLLGE